MQLKIIPKSAEITRKKASPKMNMQERDPGEVLLEGHK